MGSFAPADLFACLAAAVESDPDLPKGTHLRVLPSPPLGFPIAPFGVYRITPLLTEPEVIWCDESGKILNAGDLRVAGEVLIGDIVPPPADHDAKDIAVVILLESDFVGTVELLDRVSHSGFARSDRTKIFANNRVYAIRSKPPFVLGGPTVERVRIRGRGAIVKLQTWRVFASRALEEMIGRPPVAIMSLPLEGSQRWYAQACGENAAIDRVVSGAPLRLTRPDQPDGPFDPLTPSDEKDRIGIHAAEVKKLCEFMLADPAVSPRKKRLIAEITPAGGPRNITDLSVESSLLIRAMDPGIGRYLGLVTRLDELPERDEPRAYAALGLFAFARDAQTGRGRLTNLLGDQHPAISQVINRFIEVLDNHPVSRDSRGELKRLLRELEQRGTIFRALVAPVGAVPVADLVELPTPTLGNSNWLSGGDKPATEFRQDFLFLSHPMGVLIAMGRSEANQWKTRHRDELGALATLPKRANILLMGRTRERRQFLSRGFLSDSPVLASTTAVRYRFALADVFGRYGPAVEISVPTPQRPAPPMPAPQVEVILDGPLDGPDVPMSPGHAKVSVPIPFMMDLAAGSLDIVSVKFIFDGLPAGIQPIPAEPAFSDEASRANRQMRIVTLDIVFPALAVAEARTAVLAVSFIDTAGQHSPEAKVTVAFADRRRPKVIPTGLGLIWTSKPGPSPEVELKLAWPGTPGIRYRVYMADEKSLGIGGTSRAAVAVQGGQKDRAGTLGQRDRFRLLTDPPIEASSSGMARLNENLPRSLASVQFLRIVPLTAAGQESPFDSCGVVPVAVPTDRKPPPPRVIARVNQETGRAIVTIEAIGLDLEELKAAEPNLFGGPPTGAANPPEFRLRRASGALNDPVYAREIARGVLHPLETDDGILFRTDVDDPEITPFVRYSYWAEVRLPPERRLIPGLVEIPPAGGVAAVETHGMRDIPRPFSSISAPATVILTPVDFGTISGAAASIEPFDPTNVQLKLVIADVPLAHRKAVGKFRLRIWARWGVENTELLGDGIDIETKPVIWTGGIRTSATAPNSATLFVQMIDPIGREGSLVTLAT